MATLWMVTQWGRKETPRLVGCVLADNDMNWRGHRTSAYCCDIVESDVNEVTPDMLAKANADFNRRYGKQ